MKLYNDKNDVYYMFDKSELYFILAQCVVTGASLATTAFLVYTDCKIMKLVIQGRLPCMNDLITANRRNRYAGAKLKKDTQRQIEDVLLPQIQLRSTARYGFSGKVAVTVRFYEPDKRRDEDNVLSGMKFIFDAMQGID